VSVRVRIHGFAHGGEGVGREEDGLTWFVPGALPGELVEVEPEQRKARWARGRLAAVLEAAPDRAAPHDAAADRCGGCDWQHVAAARQGEHKREIVAGELRALVPDPARVLLHPVAGPATGYRRRARMHYEKVPPEAGAEAGDEAGAEAEVLRLGFFARGSHDILDAHRCPVLRPELQHAFDRVRALAPYLPRQGQVLGLSDGEHAVLALPGVRPEEDVLAAAHALLDDRLVGILLRGGRRSVAVGQHELRLDGGDGLPPMGAHPFVFTQANAAVNRALVKHVARVARADGKRVLELYAGAGNLTRALARTAQRVWTVDDDREAKILLRAMAEAESLPINAKHGSAENLVASLHERKIHYDVVVIDPPRAGLGEAASAHLAAVVGERLVYVSCDPSTLARDLKVLVAGGLRLVDVTVFDMMPMTAEVEVVATLERPAQGARA
jgi:23S rRNA (uracil1939-C5)-methyltransferase